MEAESYRMRDFSFFSPWALVTRGNYFETHHAATCIIVCSLTAGFPLRTVAVGFPIYLRTDRWTVSSLKPSQMTSLPPPPPICVPRLGMGIYFLGK